MTVPPQLCPGGWQWGHSPQLLPQLPLLCPLSSSLPLALWSLCCSCAARMRCSACRPVPWPQGSPAQPCATVAPATADHCPVPTRASEQSLPGAHRLFLLLLVVRSGPRLVLPVATYLLPFLVTVPGPNSRTWDTPHACPTDTQWLSPQGKGPPPPASGPQLP